MTRSAERFADTTIALLVRRLAVVLRELGYGAPDVREHLVTICALLGHERQAALGALGTFFEKSAIGERWNQALRDERAPFLGRLIAPHAVDSVLDLLSGNCSVARSLETLTRSKVSTVERLDCGGGLRGGAVLNFDEFVLGASDAAYDTVLLCTVLHHEWDPLGLLELAVRVARRRVILVENCIDEDCPAEYQELVDLIFNESLNRTSLPCPCRHGTLHGWLAMAGPYGMARAVASVPAAPGVPLSHDVIVIEKRS